MPPKKNTKQKKELNNMSNEEFNKLRAEWLTITNKIINLEDTISSLKTTRDNIVIKIIDYNVSNPENLLKLPNTELTTNANNNLSSDEDDSDISSISDSDSEDNSDSGSDSDSE